MRKRFFAISLGVISIVGAACATTGGMRAEPIDEGVSRTYTASLGDVVAATRDAMVGAGIQVEEASQVDATTWMILGKKSVSAFSWGEKIRTVIQETGPEQVSVRVITKRRLATNISAKGDWSQSIFDQIAMQLQTSQSR